MVNGSHPFTVTASIPTIATLLVLALYFLPLKSHPVYQRIEEGEQGTEQQGMPKAVHLKAVHKMIVD